MLSVTKGNVMMAIQLDFFKTDEECKIDLIQERTDSIQISLDKVRKGTYASIGEIRKKLDDVDQLRMRLEIIERNICNGK